MIDSLPAAEPFKKSSGYGNENVSKESSSSNTLELWKNGEMYWKEGKLDDSYLRNNPDRFNRISTIDLCYILIYCMETELQGYFVAI